jgi:tetraacyldisaccharide 4'-kinase
MLLPAGPLREPASRIETVDAVVLTRRTGSAEAALRPRRPFIVEARFDSGRAVNLVSGERRELATFRGARVHAFAGIGNPQAFFAALGDAGIAAETLELADHGTLDTRHLPFPDGTTVLMTEKDAVKYASYAPPDWWYVELDVVIERETALDLMSLVLERAGLTGAGVKLG